MSTPALIAIIGGSALLLIVIVLLLVRGGGKKSSSGGRQMCGGCNRVILPQWDKCMFCGWEPPPKVPRLEFISGPLTGQVVMLTAEITTLGSVAGNTIVLSDPAVSKKHLGIHREGKRYVFADLGSTNGVYVNGHKMPKKALGEGDILRVGNTEFCFRAG